MFIIMKFFEFDNYSFNDTLPHNQYMTELNTQSQNQDHQGSTYVTKVTSKYKNYILFIYFLNFSKIYIH